MTTLPSPLRRSLESAVLDGRRAAEAGVRASLSSLGVDEEKRPKHLTPEKAVLRKGLRAKQRQLGSVTDVLVWECAYEQWHRLLFARFLSENDLLIHPEFRSPVSIEDCAELADELKEPDAWSVAARFASEILPGIFRLDDPCVKLRLAPEHRIALERIVEGLPAEVFTAEDSLGWVYQYWQKERKDKVNASEVKIGGADLGPVTQLFTENYMVRFLLENSLGAWWAARHPDSPLLKDFDYLRFDDEGMPAAGVFDGWPASVAEVTMMDPCCGSGHFLVEGFGMLWRMRAEEEGLSPIAAQDAVLKDNLFGLELDPRCVQIAMFAVALTAWKHGGGWRELPIPNIACSGIPAKAPLEEWTALAKGDQRLELALERLHTLFKDADTLGSLIDPRRAAEMARGSGGQSSTEDVDFAEVAPLLQKAASRESDDPATAVLGADAAGIARAADLLARRYTLVATNVPYLKRANQALLLQEWLRGQFPGADGDIATAALTRCLRMTTFGGAASTVTPQSWLSLRGYEKFRRNLLGEYGLSIAGRLGSGAFAGISGEVVKVVLTVIQLGPRQHFRALRLDGQTGAPAKDEALRSRKWDLISISSQLESVGARLSMVEGGGATLLGEYASAMAGIQTGDYPRFGRKLWELSSAGEPWRRQQSTVEGSSDFAGREHMLLWRRDGSDLAMESGAFIRGRHAWGRQGVAVSQMGDLPVSRYTGELFDNNTAALVPTRVEDLPAIWAFTSSGEFARAVREIETSIKVTNSTLTEVPFDIDHWRKVAEELYPDGLPEPWSDDPTQWLFEGRPEVATEPLQVAVGRLLGFRWPEQPETDDLDEFKDVDGIVCLPAVGGEQPAVDRLQAVLARAFGKDFTTGKVHDLLEQAGSQKKNLGDWLRTEFFKHHCKVFANRPFIWHIWDGRSDGFSALVNYHRLDHAMLQKLTYTYLGDWIERQRADANSNVAGADLRLAAGLELKTELEAILEGEPPYDIYVRWKALHEQPIGWAPDPDDGVRLNIRPFVEAGILRTKFSIHWRKDRGKNPDGTERHNDLHYTNAQKQAARQKAGKA